MEKGKSVGDILEETINPPQKAMELPKNKSGIQSGFPTQDSWLIFGEPKVGKTTLASQFPDPLIIDFENGTNYIEGYKIQPQNLNDIKDIYYKLKKETHGYKTIVVDTIDRIYEWIEKRVCIDRKVKDIGDIKWGGGYGEARTSLFNFINLLKGLGLSLVFTAHSKASIIDGEPSSGKSIDLPGKTSRRFTAEIDNILYLRAIKKEGKICRQMEFCPYEDVEAGSRNPVLQDQVIDITSIDGFKEIEKLFKKGESDERRLPSKK